MKPQHHFAFIVGSDNYLPPLRRMTKCVQDATDMRDCLVELGYPRGNVHCVLNGTREEIVDAFRLFYPTVKSSPRATVFVYFSGHGVENGVENALLGVDCVGGILTAAGLVRCATDSVSCEVRTLSYICDHDLP